MPHARFSLLLCGKGRDPSIGSIEPFAVSQWRPEKGELNRSPLSDTAGSMDGTDL
jgi:hypothetical protein